MEAHSLQYALSRGSRHVLQKGLFERLHEVLGGDAWLVGRVTGQEFAKREAYPAQAAQSVPREPWFARRGLKAARCWKAAWFGFATDFRMPEPRNEDLISRL
jgi:hypothetical protein